MISYEAASPNLDEWFYRQPSMVATLIWSTLLRLLQNFRHSKWNQTALQQVEITDNSTATLASRARQNFILQHACTFLCKTGLCNMPINCFIIFKAHWVSLSYISLSCTLLNQSAFPYNSKFRLFFGRIQDGCVFGAL